MWSKLPDLLAFQMSLRVTPQKIVHYLEAHGQTSRDNLAFITPEAVRLAPVALPARPYGNLKEFLFELLSRTSAAVEAGAQLVVFPEYTGMLPLTMIPRFRHLLEWAMKDDNPPEFYPDRLLLLTETFQHYLYELYYCAFGNLARLQRVCIAAGSILVYEGGRLHNRCVVFGPDGEPLGSQDKVAVLGLDRALGVAPADQIEAIPTPLGPLGVVIGSDAYYFECFQIARSQGAKLFAVPASGDETLPALLSCRAAEQGVYLAYAPLSSEEGAAACVFSPGQIPLGGSSAAVRVNLQKLDSLFYETAPSPEFLTGDYLDSYRFLGNGFMKKRDC